MATTFEEAKKCPKCNQPGEDKFTKPSIDRRGQRVELHFIFCRTVLCPWNDTNWVVQVNSDGSIPEAYNQLGPKNFPLASKETESRINDAIQAQLNAETREGGGEIRG